jgi:hypothetical protein
VENPRYGGQLQQADGVDSLVGDSFDSWSDTVISEFGVLDLSSCNLTAASSMCSQIPRVAQKKSIK